MEDQDSNPDIDLFCPESFQDILDELEKDNFQSDNELQRNDDAYDSLDLVNYFAQEIDEFDYIRNLVMNETVFAPRTYANFLPNDTELQDIRSDCIQRILNARSIHEFQFHTAYLSVTYFDRYLSEVYPDDHNSLRVYHLACVACFALAAKLVESQVKSLLKLLVGNFHFEFEELKRMEGMVVKKLHWKLCTITPFAYLCYFTVKICGQSIPKEIVPKAVHYIMESLNDDRFLKHKPSVIAAGAVLAAFSDRMRKNEFQDKLAAISSIGPLDSDDVHYCYIEMLTIESRKHGTPLPPNLRPNPFDQASSSTGAGARKRLQFDDSDQHSPTKRTRHT